MDCRPQTLNPMASRLSLAAQRIRPAVTWDGAVLPPAPTRPAARNWQPRPGAKKSFEGWGFGEKDGVNLGITALFTGPPVTGKTMAAEVIAGRRSPLYRIDLSAIIQQIHWRDGRTCAAFRWR